MQRTASPRGSRTVAGVSKQPRVIETLADLTPNPRNARRHNPRNVGMLEKALGEVGAARSIVIDEHGVVLAGNATIEAAARAGIEKVQVVDADGETIIAVRRTGLTAKQKTRLALYDNRTAELADWDADVIADLLATERELLDGLFADDELAELLDDLGEPETVDAEPQMDRAAELNKKWQVQAGDLWRIGEHRLLCGDSTKREDVERVLAGDVPVLMVTDPPYGVEYDAERRFVVGRQSVKGGAVGKVTNDDRSDWREAWALFPGNVLYVWHAGVKSFIVADSLMASGFAPRALIVWAKSSMVPLPYGINPVQVESLGLYHHQHEPCWYAFRQGASVRWIGDRTQTTLWEIDKPQKSETGHSTQKPLECMARPMRNHDAPEVYDPFLGSGTTMVACENLQRKCRGIEISPDYCAVILERMATAFPALAIERA